ncbi:OmpA family protein [Roseospira marina]|uniref:OmpA family protein n=1 Tax=Roseospira marina TaxID=140057 RepID=UPI0014787E42|nr:OmpA family protein [Roseospira marina]MBB4312852.1 outer membrane protein OmpA-like peptidoglycan-associated protein [Roseospira marina]MBB5086375.1 outer membrane protein OmpA-like peptidoglycan-associated protein [Roseospira marina]
MTTRRCHSLLDRTRARPIPSTSDSRLTSPGVALLAALSLAGALAGCAGDPPPEAAGAYPDISESPSQPPPVSSAREREEVAEGLRADRRETRYSNEGGTRQRSSEVRPPEFSPPAEAPAETSLAQRMDAGEQPPEAPAPAPSPAPAEAAAPAESGVDRSTLPPPPGAGRDPLASAPRAPAQALLPPETPPGSAGPRELPPPAVPSPYGTGGPIVVDSRGVTTTGPGGTVSSPGPYPVAASVTPGTQSLSTYGPMAGARSQRVAVIYFADGSSRLSNADRQVLGQVAALQRQYGGLLRVIGHASSRTGATSIAQHKLANFNVSLARANSVAEALIGAGVPGRFLYVGAASDSQPVYLEIMPTGEAGNRRTEIYLDY